MAKGKKKGNSKKKALNLTFVDDAFYRLTIQDCEKKIDRLQKHLGNLEVNNKEIKGRIHSLNYDQADKAGDLTRSLHSYDESIYKYNEEIHILSQELAGIRSQGDATIMDLEEKYKAMHDQLTCEIKLLKAKLQMLDDFRVSENKLNVLIENEKELLEEENQEYKNVITKMKLKIQGEKRAMQKEIETKLICVSEEFTRSSALRGAAYAQRLIRENIALEKEIDVLKSSQEAMDQQLKEHTARCKEVKETFSALNRKKRDLIFVAQQKTNLIEKITTKYEKLKNAYTDSLLYKNQYQDLVQYQLCKHFKQHQMITQAKKLASRAHFLKAECHYLENKYEANEKEIVRLRDVIVLIRKTILNAVRIFEKAPQTTTQGMEKKTLQKTNFESLSSKNSSKKTEYEEESSAEIDDNTVNGKSQDFNLLEVLLDVLERLKIDATPTASIETVTPNSFLLQYSDLVEESSDSMREPFKQSDTSKRGTVSQFLEDAHLFKQESKALIPKERVERGLIFDVEKGSSFYASSSKTEAIVEEHEPDEFRDDQKSSSYGSISSQQVEDKPTSVPKRVEVESDSIQFPPGTIIDVEMDEEGEITSLENENDLSNNIEEIYSVKETTGPEDEMSVYMFY